MTVLSTKYYLMETLCGNSNHNKVIRCASDTVRCTRFMLHTYFTHSQRNHESEKTDFCIMSWNNNFCESFQIIIF